MPRVKGATVNKSEEIRKILASSPRIKAREVVAQLEARGIKVKPNMVYFIKTRAKMKARKAKRVHAISAGRRAGVSDPVQLVLKVKALAADAGGVRNLKQLVDALAE